MSCLEAVFSETRSASSAQGEKPDHQCDYQGEGGCPNEESEQRQQVQEPVCAFLQQKEQHIRGKSSKTRPPPLPTPSGRGRGPNIAFSPKWGYGLDSRQSYLVAGRLLYPTGQGPLPSTNREGALRKRLCVHGGPVSISLRTATEVCRRL